MTSSFQTHGSIQTEKGLSNLSTSSKNTLANFYDWASSKYGLSNISSLTSMAERNGIFDNSNKLDDFNLLFGIQLNSHEITTFKQSDIDLTKNTISLTTLDFGSNSTLQVGDVINITFSSGSNGALPSGLTSSSRLFIKAIDQESSSYKLTLSSAYDGDTFNFSDNGIANYASDSFAVRYSSSTYVFNFKYDQTSNEWNISNYSGNSNSSFSLENLNSNPNLSVPEYFGLFDLNKKENDKVVMYTADYGYDISLTGTSSININNSLNQNLQTLGIDLTESRWGTYIYDQITTTNSGLLSVVRDSSKYKFVKDSDGSNPEIIYELDRPTESGSSKRVMQLLEAADGSLYYVLEHQYYKDSIDWQVDNSVVKISTDKSVQTTTLTSKTFPRDNSTVGGIGNYEYQLVPESDGDVWLLKEERVNGADGTTDEAFKYTAWRFNNSNFDINDPDIILDSLLDLSNHYSAGQFLVDTSGEEYNFNFSHTNDSNTHTLFKDQADAIDEAINYAVSIGDDLTIEENNTTTKTFTHNSDVTWSIAGGNDSDLFEINSSTGELTFKVAPDYENPTDSDNNNIYHLLIRSTDQENIKRDERVLLTISDQQQLINISDHQVGTSYHLEYIKDYDGNLHANTGSVSDATKTSYKYQGLIDVNNDGVKEAIYTNKESGRWVTGSIDSSTGEIDYEEHGQGGTTRVVGIYIDPLVTSGEVEQFGPHDSQRRFQNDLKIDNLIAKTSGDYDGDGFQEVYWKTNDGTAYLRALMHADGNIQYANYQNAEQMSDYLTSRGFQSEISNII